MKGTDLWDLTQRSPVEVYGRFGRMFSLHFQARAAGQANNQQDASNNYSEQVEDLVQI
jgi:hypothetical protein